MWLQVARLFERWLSERHGDEDIAPPNSQLAAALGITIRPEAARVLEERWAQFLKGREKTFSLFRNVSPDEDDS